MTRWVDNRENTYRFKQVSKSANKSKKLKFAVCSCQHHQGALPYPYAVRAALESQHIQVVVIVEEFQLEGFVVGPQTKYEEAESS